MNMLEPKEVVNNLFKKHNREKPPRASSIVLTFVILTGLFITPMLGLTVNLGNLSDGLLIKFKPGVSEEYKESLLLHWGLE